MKIPYNCLHARGGILFASRGGRLHSFNLSDMSFISTWTHPAVESIAESAQEAQKLAEQSEDVSQTGATNASAAAVEEVPAQEDGDEPPAKRAKVEPEAADKPDAKQEDKPKGKKKKGGKDGQKDNMRLAHVPDRPIIIQLTSTEDGKHVVAVTGHDKAVWVFEHDGNGNLKELSKRVMPKRPSSIVVTSEANILSADKFGDVYQLPLIPSADFTPKPSTLAALSKQPFTKPAATPLTVHSKGNLQALANQQRQIELEGSGKEISVRAEEPNFELLLLLGHVSMLTSLCIGQVDGRKYILTCDRDEHIRVSRFTPQAHIIQSFCLGHKHFINDMTIPELRPEILVSGGGDDDLFVWDWVNGNLLSTVSMLDVVKTIAADTAAVAVSHLCSLTYPDESGPLPYVLAICEGISGIFTWKVTEDGSLKYPGIIQLPGKPLDLVVVPGDKPTIAVALHTPETSEAKSVHVFELGMNDDRLCVNTDSVLQDNELDQPGLEATDAEIKGLFYTVEQLRKQSGGNEEEGGGQDDN